MNLLKSEKNKHDFVLETEIKQMKMLCLSNFNNQFELFKLLEKDSLNDLIVKIPKKSYSMYVSLDNNKPTLIDKETSFLRNLDNYISFIKDNFDISVNSVIDIVEATIINYNNNDMLYCLDEGDLTGDGKINSGDLLQMRKYLLEEVNLQGAYKDAGIIESKNEIKSLDLLRLRQYLLGEYVIK